MIDATFRGYTRMMCVFLEPTVSSLVIAIIAAHQPIGCYYKQREGMPPLPPRSVAFLGFPVPP